MLREPRADQRFRAYIRKAGLYPTLRKAWRELLRQGPGLLWRPPDDKRRRLPLAPPGVAASTLFPGRLLLLGEGRLDGGAAQLCQRLLALGHACHALEWGESAACLEALQTCSVLILCRLPACERLTRLLDEARRLKVECYWYADEQVFDPVRYRQGADLDGLCEGIVGKLLAAVALHRQALLACDGAIAATPVLADAMREAGAQRVSLVEPATHAGDDRQLAQLFPPVTAARPRRLLAANIFFAPRSFGGATVVAEQMARLLASTSSWQQFIFTSLPSTDTAPYHLLRYQAQDVAVLGMGLPEQRSAVEDFENHATVPLFEAVLEQVAPDLVHLHSIQGLGALLAESCAKKGIPFVVTLHDAWWICGRQFMIDNHGEYCGQTRIDTHVCAACVDDAALNAHRQQSLAATLRKASLLLAPSRFARDLYLANGFDAARLRVNRNGILPPAADYQHQPGPLLRFGFVGGNTRIKGIDLITRAFAGLPRSDYELKVVDNLLHLGFRSFNRHSVKIPGTVSIIPGYTQDNLDAFFAGIDVLLFPTQWKETFGLAVREALVRDVWVISTDAGGTVEDIVDGVNGTIIPLSSDPRYLRQALADVLEHQERFRQHHNRFKGNITLCSDQALELEGLYGEALQAGAWAYSRPAASNSLE
ncbi:glycosyltransferase family 4 protein [Pseudomonas sp. UFMG81]|uniref:glycosyltransferase family 4 protein n=1 Tax=Pseudomonas sp. UFMG81 TaxID=2745936 RepID=UPI002B279E49|nr:glycosyltransferase family 4 protein [Pseudomonas sp. UFMG81]